jgi:hypothetical protein
MKGNTEELYYGYKLNIYISVGLIGIDAVCIAKHFGKLNWHTLHDKLIT